MNESLKKEQEKADRTCKVCHGTGYLKSHSDAPDRPCPYCRYTIESLKEENESFRNQLFSAREKAAKWKRKYYEEKNKK